MAKRESQWTIQEAANLIGRNVRLTQDCGRFKAGSTGTIYDYENYREGYVVRVRFHSGDDPHVGPSEVFSREDYLDFLTEA